MLLGDAVLRKILYKMLRLQSNETIDRLTRSDLRRTDPPPDPVEPLWIPLWIELATQGAQFV